VKTGFKILPRSFYLRDTSQVAKDLLGKILVRVVHGQLLAGIIVETEAYKGIDDPASHAFKGKTPRTEVMFGLVGHAYIYFIYGMHFNLNIVAHEKKKPSGGVLIRAVEPIIGIDIMKEVRKVSSITNISNGPGKIGQAFFIDRSLYGCDVTHAGPLFVAQAPLDLACDHIVEAPRIGITRAQDKLWRFYYEHNPYVSRR